MGYQSSTAQFNDFVKPLIGLRAETARDMVARYQDQAVSNPTIDYDGVKAILGDAVPDEQKDDLIAPLGDVDVAKRVVILAVAGSDLSLTDQAFELTQLAVDYQSEELGAVDADGVAAVARALIAAASAAATNLEGDPAALLEQAGTVAEKIISDARAKAAEANEGAESAGGGGGDKVDALEVSFAAASSDECASLMEFVSDAADEEFEAGPASGAGEHAGADDEDPDEEFDVDGDEYPSDYEADGVGEEEGEEAGEGEGDEGAGEGKEGDGDGDGDGPTVETIGGKADDVGHMAVKPWEGAIKASEPAGWAGPDYEPPLCDLELEWVHGVACYDYRLDYNKTIYNSAIGYDASGRVVFPAGGMVVVQSTGEAATQQYFTGHGRCRVTSLAVSPDGTMAASGDRGAKPRVLIWSLEEQEEDRSGGSGEVEDFFEDEASLKARNKRKAARAKRGRRKGPSSKYHKNPKKRLTKPRDPALSLKRIATIPLKHGMREVKSLAWSPSGNRVGFACMDDKHTVYVYDVRKGEMLLANSGSSAEYVCSVAFQDEDTLVVSDKRQVNFWDVRTGRSSRGISHPKMRGDPLLALCTVPPSGDGEAASAASGRRGRRRAAPSGTVYGVSAKGYAVKFAGRRMADIERVSRQPVFSIARNPATGQLVCGASDGTVAVLDPDALKVESKIESLVTRGAGGKPVSKLNQVVAIAASQDGTKNGAVLRSGRVMEMDAGSGDLLHGGRPVVHGHWCPRVFSELWGVAAHPTEQRFVTSGDDNTLRLWDAQKCAQLAECDLGSLIRCVSFSGDGNLVAVGFGGDLGGTVRGKDKKLGGFAVLNAETLELVYESARPLSKEWISDCKFSPDSKYLAIGSHDNCVYVMDATDGYRVVEKLRKSNSFVVHFDWSANSKYIRVNDGAHELLFYDATTGRHVASASELKQEKWASEHCTIQWATMAAHNETIDMNAVRACDLSKQRGVLAVGDEKRQLRLFRFPACDEKQQSKVFGGHSSFVTNVRWLPGDERLVSVSGADRVVFQWKVDGPTDAEDFLAFAAAADDAAARAARGGAGDGPGAMNVGSAAVDGPEPEIDPEAQAEPAPAPAAAAPAASSPQADAGSQDGGSGCCVVS